MSCCSHFWLRLAAFSLWVGAAISRAATPNPGETKAHWAFVPPTAPPVPAKTSRWIRNPIDAFVMARLDQERVKPSAEADRPTLLRRITLDLTGLPPTPEEVAAFVADPAPDAYERRVDALLASPHFGERWGRHWLDLARYADSSGYQVDRERPWAWVYRDWVIRSLNQDQPFDEFTREQIAGDLLPNATPDQRIAAGFHRMTLSNHEDGVDAAEFAAKAKVDRVATTGLVWLGLTLGCAECHSHKYDPISQREFYQLYAIFEAAEEADAEVAPGVTAYTFKAREKVPETRIHIRGDFLRPGDAVEPGWLKVVGPGPRSSDGPKPAAKVGRLELADWLVARENPLTARVAVNQLWLHLFGRGLVATTEDFGVRGERPSHPELLDWLALELMNSGWSRKHLIRLIVTSATYRQASKARPELAERDPGNRWLARQNRVRLEGEILRDSALAVGDQLNRVIGGRSFRPYLPEDMKWLGTAGAWSWTDDSGPVLFRRSLYMYSQRTVPHPLLPTFDQANPNEVCTKRERSNNALQPLTLLNNATFVGAAQAMARQMSVNDPKEVPGAITSEFYRCLGRPPTPAEQRRLEELYAQVWKASPTQAMFVVAQTLLNLDEFQTRE